MTDILKLLGNVLNPIHKVGPLNAIWIEKGLVTKNGKVYRIAPGDFITIKDGKLIDSNDDPTHVITSCNGNIANTELFIVCADVKTFQLQKIDML